MLAVGALESCMASATHRLFFALRPPAPIAAAIGQVAEKLKATGIVEGSWLKAAKYHITLHFLGTHDHFPARLRERAGAALAGLAADAREIEFDRIASFQSDLHPPCVLRACRRMRNARTCRI